MLLKCSIFTNASRIRRFAVFLGQEAPMSIMQDIVSWQDCVLGIGIVWVCAGYEFLSSLYAIHQSERAQEQAHNVVG